MIVMRRLYKSFLIFYFKGMASSSYPVFFCCSIIWLFRSKPYNFQIISNVVPHQTTKTCNINLNKDDVNHSVDYKLSDLFVYQFVFLVENILIGWALKYKWNISIRLLQICLLKQLYRIITFPTWKMVSCIALHFIEWFMEWVHALVKWRLIFCHLNTVVISSDIHQHNTENL